MRFKIGDTVTVYNRGDTSILGSPLILGQEYKVHELHEDLSRLELEGILEGGSTGPHLWFDEMVFINQRTVVSVMDLNKANDRTAVMEMFGYSLRELIVTTTSEVRPPRYSHSTGLSKDTYNKFTATIIFDKLP